MRSNSPILILGLGNDILTDDAVGLQVVRALRESLDGDPEIAVEETCEMGLALLDYFVDRRAVILVDSIQTGRVPPGTVHDVDAMGLRQLSGRTPHFLGVGETLALGRTLGLNMPEAVRIIAVEVADPFTLGTELTAAVREALPGVVERVKTAARELASTLAAAAWKPSRECVSLGGTSSRESPSRCGRIPERVQGLV